LRGDAGELDGRFMEIDEELPGTFVARVGYVPGTMKSISGASNRIAVGAITALGFASCYFQLFIYPAMPLVPSGDQVLSLQNAIRMLDGKLPYRDFPLVTTPGTEVLYALLIHAWGAKAWIPNLAMAVLGAALTLLIALIAMRVLHGGAALLPAALFAGLVLPGSLYATHHWFSTLSILAALLVLIDGVTVRRAAAAGVFCGIAGYFTQTSALVVVCALLVFFVLERSGAMSWKEIWRRCAALCGAAGVVLISAEVYFIGAAGLSRFLFWTVVAPIRYYPATKPFNTWRVYGLSFRGHVGIGHLLGLIFVHALVPLVYVAFFIRRNRHKGEEKREHAQLLIALVGIGLFLPIMSAPSALRLFTVAAPAVILLVCLLTEYQKASWTLYAGSAVALILAVAIPIREQIHWRGTLDTPAGRLASLDPEMFGELQWTALRTHGGEAFFGSSTVCYALGLKNRTPLNFTTPDDFTRPSEVAELVQSLENDRVPLMVLVPGGSQAQSNYEATDHMGPFREYLQENYRLEERFGTGDEAWIRVDAKPDGKENRSVGQNGSDAEQPHEKAP
jgi:hypothetical protein